MAFACEETHVNIVLDVIQHFDTGYLSFRVSICVIYS